MKYQSIFGLTLFFLVLLISGCETQNDPCAHEFDQEAMLSNIGDNIIMPSYQDLQTKVNAMQSAAQTFVGTPTENNLASLRSTWKAAWLSWQAAAIFEFGPAETEELRTTLNNFPANVSKLNEGVQSGTYDLNSLEFSYANGFPALDYLLYGVAANDADVVAQYTTDTLASNRKQYLNDVANQIKTKVDAVLMEWGDSYLNTFKTTTGVAAGQPMSLLVNQLNANYELIKNNKIGTPVGAKISYITQADKVEAYYSRISLELAVKAVEASKNVFLGGNGLGLDDYLAAAEAVKNDSPLEQLIEEQYDLALTELNAINGSLHDALNSDLEQVKTAYAAVQNQVVYTKTDMPSVLCISITYVDNTDDGD